MEYGKRIFNQYGWTKERTPMNELKRILFEIENAMLCEYSHAVAIYAARYVLTEYDRDLVPDWVRVLAGGNPDNFEAVVDETLRWKKAEEEENASGDNSY